MKGKAEFVRWPGHHQQSELADANIYSIAYSTKSQDTLPQEHGRRRTNSVGQTSVDFETAITHTGYGKFNYYLLLISLPATCTSCFDTAALSIVLPIAKCDMGLSSVEAGFLNSVIYAGMILSSFLWGFLSDTLGRRNLMVIGYLLDAVMIIGYALAQTLWMMAFFRFMAGFMICGPYAIFMTYLSETFDSKHRDLAVLATGVYYALGSILQPALAMAIIPWRATYDLPWLDVSLPSWRLFLLLCSVPSFVSSASLLVCVESPKFLMEKGRQREALNVFGRIHSINTGLPPTSYPVKKLQKSASSSELDRTGVEDGSKLSRILKALAWQATALFRKPFLSRTCSTFLLEIGLLASLNVVRLWMPQLFSELDASGHRGQGEKDLNLCTLLTSNFTVEESCHRNPVTNQVQVGLDTYTNVMYVYGMCLVINTSCSLLIKWVSKRVLLVLTAGLPAVGIVLMSFVDTSYVVPLAGLYISFLNCYFTVLMAVIVELFPTSLRATSVSMNMMVGRCGIFVANMALSDLLYSQCYLVFGILGATLGVMCVGSLLIPKADSEDATDKPEA